MLELNSKADIPLCRCVWTLNDELGCFMIKLQLLVHSDWLNKPIRLLVTDQQIKFGQECQLHQQSYLGQFFGEWEDLRHQYKTEWDCFRCEFFFSTWFWDFLPLFFLSSVWIGKIGYEHSCFSSWINLHRDTPRFLQWQIPSTKFDYMIMIFRCKRMKVFSYGDYSKSLLKTSVSI